MVADSHQNVEEMEWRLIARYGAVLLLAHLAVSQAGFAPAAKLRNAEVNEYPGDPISAVTALLNRILPATLASQFTLQIIPQVRLFSGTSS